MPLKSWGRDLVIAVRQSNGDDQGSQDEGIDCVMHGCTQRHFSGCVTEAMEKPHLETGTPGLKGAMRCFYLLDLT